jgi:hypothetical protein
MQIIFQCPRCETQAECRPQPDTAAVTCLHCDWQRDNGANDFDNIKSNVVCRCRVCGCDDLWRQKDFPPALGLAFVGMGILLSSLAWAWHYPEWALGILMAFALIDMVLYTFMGDMLVCYRCRSRHRKTAMDEEHPAFNLGISERYIQMKKRQDSEPPLR